MLGIAPHTGMLGWVAYLLSTDVVLHCLVIVEPLLGAELRPLLLLPPAVSRGTGTHEAAQVGLEEGLVWNAARQLEQLQATSQTRVATGPKLLHFLWVCE